MGEAIVKGASNAFKKAHDGFENWIDNFNSAKLDAPLRYGMPVIVAFLVVSGVYEVLANVSNAHFETDFWTFQSSNSAPKIR